MDKRAAARLAMRGPRVTQTATCGMDTMAWRAVARVAMRGQMWLARVATCGENTLASALVAISHVHLFYRRGENTLALALVAMPHASQQVHRRGIY